MMKKIFSLYYFHYYGIIKKKEISSNSLYTYPENSCNKIEHKRYLKELVSSENERQNAIEGKTSQLIGQCGLIFSLLGLFVPMFFDKFSDFSFIVKLIIVLPFLTAFFFFILTINNAIRNYNIKNFNYVSGSPSTVCKNNSDDDFHNEEIRDLISAIGHNTMLNNDKGSNLLHAFRAFRAANFCIAVMGLIICILMLGRKEEKANSIQIITPIRIQNLDSNMLGIKNELIEIKGQIKTPYGQIIKDTCK